MLIHELTDAHEHLAELIKQMEAEGKIDDPDFAVELGHAFAHPNRAWHGRDDAGLGEEITADDWAERSRFPDDLTPVG